MTYSHKKYKGLQIVRARWEAYLQHINICHVLEKVNDPNINKFKSFEDEKRECLNKLEIENEGSLEKINLNHIRERLKEIEFKKWFSLPHKGRGYYTL